MCMHAFAFLFVKFRQYKVIVEAEASDNLYFIIFEKWQMYMFTLKTVLILVYM